jgi:hypothetical protein
VSNFKFKRLIRKFFNLAFVPTAYVKNAFDKLVLVSEEFDIFGLKEFIEYFKFNFIGDETRIPLFEIKFWNCGKRILSNIPRTTNSLEAWHRNLNFNCNICHLNLGNFIDILIQENEKTRIKRIQAKKSINFDGKDLKKEELLRLFVLNFEFYEELEFLECLEQVFFLDLIK